jgi:hypothetical protein
MLISDSRLPLFVLRRKALWMAAALIVTAAAPATVRAGDAPGSRRFSQYRINEFAAECIECEMTFSGVKGAPAPGESRQQYVAKVEACLAAFESLGKQLEPLKTAPALQDSQPDNVARWQKISRAVTGLPSTARQARAAWIAYRMGSTQQQFGPKLMLCLGAVQVILNNLRDARP